MEFWNSVMSFCTENIVVLAIVAVLTLTATILDKTTSIFKPIRQVLKSKKEKKISKTKQIEALQQSVDRLAEKLDTFNTEVSADINSVTNELRQYIKEDTHYREQIMAAIQDLAKGNAYSLGEMIRRIYIEHEKEQIISDRDYDLLKKAYTIYHTKLGGNGPIQKMMETIEAEWTIEYR